MTICRNIIFALLLTCALIGNAFAQSFPRNETITVPNDYNTEIDSIDIYQKLINQESAKSNYEANKTGMIVGGALTVVGGLFLIASGCIAQNSRGLDDLGTIFVFFFSGVTVTPTGVVLLIYNSTTYFSRKRHAKRRDEYQQALYRYQEKKSMRFIISPAVNLLSGGGGINAVLQF